MGEEQRRIAKALFYIDWHVTSETEAARKIGCTVSQMREVQAMLDEEDR